MNLTRFFNKSTALKGLAVALWITSSVLALYALNGVADVASSIYAAFWTGGGPYSKAYYGSVALRQILIVPGSILTAAAVIGSAEYSLRRFNTPGSWRLFAHILGAEGGILLLAAML